MRILYILRTSFGTLGTNASFAIPSLVANDLDVLVLQGSPSQHEAAQPVFEPTGLTIQTAASESLNERFIKICQVIEEFQPDIIHLFFHHQALSIGSLLRHKYGSKLRILLDIRTPLLEEKPIRRFRQKLRFTREHHVFNVIATHAKESIPTHAFFIRRPIRLIPYGIHSEYIGQSETPVGFDKKSIRLVFTGSLARKRKIEALIHCFDCLLKQPNLKHDFSLHLFGDGNHRTQIEELVRALGLSKSVKFHGTLAQKDLLGGLANFDIGIGYVPTQLYGNAPMLKTMEYFAAGLPVAGTITKASGRLEQQGFRHFGFNNVAESFCKAIEAVLADKTASTAIARNKKLAQAYDWRNIVKTIVQPIYSEMMDSH